MKKSVIKNCNGFTLIEFIVYIALLVIMLATMGGVAINIMSASARTEVIEEVTHNARFAMQKMGYEIREAEGVIRPGREGDILHLRGDQEKGHILFYLEDGAVVINEEGYAPEKITTNDVVVKNLRFTNTTLPGDVGSVQIEMDVEFYNPQNVPEYNFSDSFTASYSLRKTFSKPAEKLLTDGLVGHWNFNEGSGCTVYDYSGNNNHGTLMPDCEEEDAPEWTENRFFEENRSLEFNGINNYVDVGGNDVLNITSDITVSVWLMIENTHTDWVRVFGKGDSVNRTYGLWQRQHTNQILFQQYSDSSTTSILKSFDHAIINNWYHLVGIRDSDTAYFYINGELIGSLSGRGTPRSSNEPATVGCAEFHSCHQGPIDDVRIYNRALSADEVYLLYENTKPY